jgi:hypothetical protein
VTASEASFALLLFIAGVMAMATAFTVVIDGLLLQAGAFAVGGLYVAVWSALRLIPAEERRN